MVQVSGGSDQQQSKSYVFRGQEPYLIDLYNKGQVTQTRQTPRAADIAGTVSDYYLPQVVDTLSGIGDQTDLSSAKLNKILGKESKAQQTLSALQRTGNDAGQDFMRDLMWYNGTDLGMKTLANMQEGGLNPFLRRMVNSAGKAVSRNLQRNILPSLVTGGNQANPYGGGGSRQGIAEGLALSDANQQIADLATNLYGGAYDADQSRRLSAATNFSQLKDADLARQLSAASTYNQSKEATKARRMSAANAQVQNQLSAQDAIAKNQSDYLQQLLSGSGAVLNLGMSPLQQAWNQLLNYKQVVSDPAILNSSFGSGSQSNVGIL